MNLKIRFKLWWKRIQLYWRFTFTHHPLCVHFKDQVFEINGVYFCQGCTLVFSGVVIGSILFSFLQLPISFWWWFMISGLLALPTFIVHFSSLPRMVTRIARFLFGLSYGWTIGGLVNFTNWINWLTLIGFSVFIYVLFRILYRGSKKQTDACKGCPELDEPSVCSGYQLQMEAERKYSEYATKLLQPQIEAYIQSKTAPMILSQKEQKNLEQTSHSEN